MTNKSFDTMRFIVEVIGYVVTCALAISEIVGFQYGHELAGICAAIMTMLGAILNAARKKYEGEQENGNSNE